MRMNTRSTGSTSHASDPSRGTLGARAEPVEGQRPNVDTTKMSRRSRGVGREKHRPNDAVHIRVRLLHPKPQLTLPGKDDVFPTEGGAPMQLPRRRFTFSSNGTGLPTVPGYEDLPDRPEVCPPEHEVDGSYYFFRGGDGSVWLRTVRLFRAYLWLDRQCFQ